jgi:predicted nucleotidyltransferase
MELRSVETVVKALNEAGVEYIIVGGVAVNAHGFVRMTRDLDLVLQLNRENIISGLNSLLKIGYKMAIPVSIEDFASADKRTQWINEKNMIVLKLWSDVHSRTPIDIFIYEPFDFVEEAARRLQMELSPNLFAPIVSLETLLSMKREADRPQDHLDIQELSRLQ